MSEKLEKIIQENTRYESQTPYNFCDRWCERCCQEKQFRCKLYQDEFEQKITCIAHGKEPDDFEMTLEVMKRQYEGMEKIFEKCEEEFGGDFSDIDNLGFEKIEEHEQWAKNHPLRGTSEQYFKKAHAFLENTFYKKKGKCELAYDFETIAWYHTLLTVKMQRALSGFHESPDEDEFGLHDAIAQFQICKKAIRESVEALRKIKQKFPAHNNKLLELIALLHNIHSRIIAMEESI
jgi:hypothetical protein